MLNQKQSLKEYVDDIDSVDEAIHLLQQLYERNMSALRDVLRQQIDKMDENETRNTFFNVMPIDSIIPMDLIQQSLSFIPYDDTNLVSKTFKKCSAKNKAIRERERLSVVNEHEFKPNVNYDASTNKTWIVRTAGALNEDEIKRGYLLETAFVNAIARASDGDVLRVEGYHQFHGDILIDKEIQIIGCEDGSAVIEGHIVRVIYGHMYVENIELDCVLFLQSPRVSAEPQNRTLCIKNCRLRTLVSHGCGIIYLKQCEFCQSDTRSAIKIYPGPGSVDVIGCTFKNYVHSSCISFHSQPSYKYRRHKKGMRLQFIGNVFENNKNFPIGSWRSKITIQAVDWEHSTMTHNLLVGRNIVDNANLVYTTDR